MAPMAEYSDKLEIVTEEVAICKLLTSNDLKVRKRGISSLKKWFREIGSKIGVEEDDFNRIWNGLFYYVWMSDKPLVQEEAIECISSMMHILDNYQAAMYYIRGFFISLVRQWDRISHYRIDKFLMFVRRFFRQILVLLKNHEWNIEKLELFSKELYSAIQILPYSLALHLNEIFNEEVAKISNGKIPTDSLVVLYKGYLECIVNLRPTMQIVNSIHTNIFGGLARQLKLYIKQKALTGDCENDENNTENSGSDDEEVNTSALDPRPGGVDVFLPYIDFDEHVVVKFIEQYTAKLGIPVKAKNILNQIIAMFTSISKLRTSVCDTDKLIREMQDNPKKRKRPNESLSKLIKKSCYKLEEEDENEMERDERVLKKLRNMTDIIQVPAGKSTFTVVQAKPKNKEKNRSSLTNEWKVTESTEQPSPAKKAKVSGSKTDWVVEETTPKSSEKSTVKTAKKSPVSISEQSSVICNEYNTKDDHISNNVEQSEKMNEDNERDDDDIRLEICEDDDNSNDVADEESETNENYVNSSDKSPKKQISEEPATTREEHEEDQDTNLVSESIEKEQTTVDNGQIPSPKESPKKTRSVSFSEEPTLTYYEGDDKEDPVDDSEIEIIVPASVVKTRPKLMKKDRDYVVVDFQSKAIEKNVSPEPAKVTRSLRSRKVESNTLPPVSTPESKRTRKPREKNVEPAVQRKSSRIAEKQKKVLFKLEENSYQDIPSYEKVLKSKPTSPFDSSKLPTTGILKPFAVTSPINPFYFANGERKLKRKRK